MSQDPEADPDLQMPPNSPVNDSPSFEVGPRPVRDPVIQDTGYRAGPGCPHVGSIAAFEAPCGIKSYMHVSHAGSVTPCGA